jgi:hypothetical protein
MTKKQIRETETIYLSDLEGTLEEVMTKLQDWKNEGWEGLEWSCDYQFDSTYYELYRNRLETDREYNLRMSNEKLMEERAEAHRRKQYEELRKEFGND